MLEEATEPGRGTDSGRSSGSKLRESARDNPLDQDFLERGDAGGVLQVLDTPEPEALAEPFIAGGLAETARLPRKKPWKTETDPFEEIDFGSFFDDYLDPGFKSPASETVEKPSFSRRSLSPTRSVITYRRSSPTRVPDRIRQATSIVGNLEESGYPTTPIEDRRCGRIHLRRNAAGLKAVQSLDPTGVGASTYGSVA